MVSSIDLTTWATVALAIIGLVSAAGALWLVINARQAAKVDRTLQLHRDMTTGEIRSAKRRISSLMWTIGENDNGQGVCHQPTFAEFTPAVAGVREAGRAFEYPPEIAHGPEDRPLDDLYCALRFVERLLKAFRAHLLDDDLIRELFAWNLCWWNAMLANLGYQDGTGDTPHISALREFARIAEDRKWLTPGEYGRLKRNFPDYSS